MRHGAYLQDGQLIDENLVQSVLLQVIEQLKLEHPQKNYDTACKIFIDIFTSGSFLSFMPDILYPIACDLEISQLQTLMYPTKSLL